MTPSTPEIEKEDSVPAPPALSNGDGDRLWRHRRRLLIGGATALLIVGLVFVVHYYRYAVSHESTDDAFIDGRIIAISPRVEGHVARVLATDNQQVKAGDLLVELDP
jgi:membrane fusion protein, multidrug efflux system